MDDLAGRVFLVTGANTGIGLATAREFAARGGRVYLACRSIDKGRAAAAAISAATGNRAVRAIPLDLADLGSVRACAQEFLARGEPLHVLVNNAGLPGRRGALTRDGFELAFGVNHLGHFALTLALADRLAASAPARVVTVASDAHYRAPGLDLAAVRRPSRSLTGMSEYAAAKLCNVLFAQEFARRMAGRGVDACSLHPGVVASDIWRRVPWPVRPLMKARMISPEEGARTSVWCATSPEAAELGGRYFERCAERAPSAAATPELAALLWERSLSWTAG